MKMKPFYFAFVFYYLGLFVQQVNIRFSDQLRKGLFLISIGILIIDILKSQKTVISKSLKTIVWIFIFIVVLGIATYTKDFFLMAILFFAFSVKDLDIDKLFKITFYILLVASITVVLMSILGIITELVRVRTTGFYSGNIRHALGFNWPLVLPNIVVFLGAFYGIYKKRLKWTYFVFWQLVGIVVFKFCDSRNGLIALEILLIMQLVCNRCKGNGFISHLYRRILILLSRYTFPAIALLSFILLSLYRNGDSLGYFLDEVLAHRLRWALYNFNLYPASILKIDSFENFKNTATYVTDNGYFYAVLRYGYSYIIILSILLYTASRYFENKRRYFGLITIIIISITNFIDNSLFSHGFFPIIIVSLFAIKKNIVIRKKIQLQSKGSIQYDY